METWGHGWGAQWLLFCEIFLFLSVASAEMPISGTHFQDHFPLP